MSHCIKEWQKFLQKPPPFTCACPRSHISLLAVILMAKGSRKRSTTTEGSDLAPQLDVSALGLNAWKKTKTLQAPSDSKSIHY